MKVLVTGGTGFIGGNLVRHLVERGDEVRVLALPGEDATVLEGLAVERVEGDVTDRATLDPVMRGVEGVYHVAGVVSYWRPRRAWQHRVNVEGTRNVVDAALAAGARRVVHTSSTAAIGFPEEGGVGDEDIPWNWGPYDIAYCTSKHLAEREAMAANERGLEVVAVNPTLVFGPGDVNWNAGRLFKLVAAGRVRVVEAVTTAGGVDDVCQGHIGAMERGRPGTRYILGGEVVTYEQLAREIADVMGREARISVVPQPVAWAAAAASYAVSLVTRREPPVTPEFLRLTTRPRRYSSERAARELGFPQTPLRTALEHAYAWYRERGWLA